MRASLPSRRAARLAAGVLALGMSAACAARSFTPPAPNGTPAPEGVDQFRTAVAGCAAIDTLTAEAGLSGKVAGARARGRLHLGVSRSGGFRIEGVAPFGAPVFILAGAAQSATLLLPRDQRVVANAPARELIDALAGVALEPMELLELLTGCLGHRDPLAASPDTPRAQRAGRLTLVRTDGGVEAFVDPAGAAPLLVAVRRGPLLVDYPERTAGPPRTVHVVQQAPGGPPTSDLTLRLTEVVTNEPLADAAFRVDVPADARPMTLDELRRAGPLGAR